MRGTETSLDQGLETRLVALERRDREWRPWLSLLREAFRALETGAWDDPSHIAPDTGHQNAHPLLHGRELIVNANRAVVLVSRLAAVAQFDSYRPRGAETLELLNHAVRYERAAINALAVAAGVDGHALDAVAQLAAWPLLVASGRSFAGTIPATWKHGHCPICGAWPLLAELRGLERARRLRCGRCAADWPFPGLSCVYCGEREHAHLGSLILEGPLDTRRVDTCSSCRGYLKSVATLMALSPADLLLTDLETVELDLVARERGWQRHAQPGRALDVRVRAQTP